MRTTMTVWLGVLALALGAPAASAQPAAGADEAAVKAVVDHWRLMWDRFDASVLRDDYVQDADFVNAFGTRLTGRTEILAFTTRVVQRPNVRDRRTTWSDPTVRFVRPDVAIAARDYTTEGHRTSDGKDMGVRKTHALWVLRKDGGAWHIVSQMISDENGAQ